MLSTSGAYIFILMRMRRNAKKTFLAEERTFEASKMGFFWRKSISEKSNMNFKG